MAAQISASMARAMEIYRPCANGVHVCGIDREAEEFVTVANFPRHTPAQARDLFRRLRAEFEAAEGEPRDLVVDLCVVQGDIEADFPMTRQMLDRLTRAAQA